MNYVITIIFFSAASFLLGYFRPSEERFGRHVTLFKVALILAILGPFAVAMVFMTPQIRPHLLNTAIALAIVIFLALVLMNFLVEWGKRTREKRSSKSPQWLKEIND